jgi:hypothetical protein
MPAEVLDTKPDTVDANPPASVGSASGGNEKPEPDGAAESKPKKTDDGSDAGKPRSPEAIDESQSVETPITPRGDEAGETGDDDDAARGAAEVGSNPPDKAPSASKKRGKVHTEARDIGRVYNIITDCFSAGVDRPEQTLDALLKDLRGKPRQLPDFDLNRDQSTPGTGPEDSLLFVTCHYHDIALAAAHALIRCRFRVHSKHYLDFPAAAEEDCSVDVLERIREPVSTPRVILVEITRETDFLRSLKIAGHTKIDGIKEVLRDNSTTVICVSDDRLLEDDLDETILSKEELRHWKIPFLAFILTQEFDAEEAARLHRDIDRQRRQGRWPRDASDLDDQVRSYWESGAEKLRTQIDLRQTEEGLIKAQPIRVEDTFPQDRGVEQIAICTAVYFRDLTPRDFEIVLAKVLENESIEVEETEEVVKENGEVATVKRKTSKELTAIWSEAPDAILQRCHLVQVVTGDGGRAIDFEQPYLRTQSRIFIEKKYPMLVTLFFDKLQEQGLLFDLSLSTDVTRNLVRLAVERTLNDPSYYGERWLMQSVIGIRAIVKVKLEPAGDAEMHFLRLLESLHGMSIWGQFCHRLSDVIREMLKHSSLEKIVDRFLHNLIRQHDHAAALDIVLNITRNLRFVRRFDALYWMRLLLDQGQEDVRSRTYEILHRLAVGSDDRVYDFLAGIHDWLPDSTRKPENYSLAQKLALQFIMVFTLNTARGSRAEDYGQWPSRYLLFKALDDKPGELLPHLDMLLSWILHPGLPEVIQAKVHEKTEVHCKNVADVIEMWCWILEGTNPQCKPIPGAAAVMDRIVERLCRHAGRSERRFIEKRWYEKQRGYLTQLNVLPPSERRERAEVSARRLKVIELGRRLKDLGSSDGAVRSEEDPT